MADVTIDWRELEGDDDEDWDYMRCLYTYLHPDTNEILYIGLAWNATVRERWRRSAKPDIWEYIEDEVGIEQDDVIVLVGKLETESRLTRQLLEDIEGLLINIEKPCANDSKTKNSIRRPGLEVDCRGEWPRAETYIDE